MYYEPVSGKLALDLVHRCPTGSGSWHAANVTVSNSVEKICGVQAVLSPDGVVYQPPTYQQYLRSWPVHVGVSLESLVYGGVSLESLVYGGVSLESLVYGGGYR